jgi:acyl-CoA synthetase (NDP forming)
MGFWSASSELRAFMIPFPIKPGPIAFVSQGGNLGGAVVTSAYERGVGFQRYVSCGCTADIQIEDYIEHFGQDPEVKIIMAYIEGLSDGRRFIEKVSKVTPKKPVVVLKPGKNEVTAKAIASHSGVLCGSDEVYEEGFKKAGVIRGETVEEFLDVAIGFLTQPLPQGRNVVIVTPGGSYGVLCADYCSSGGLNVITLSEKTIAQLNRIFPPRWSHGNPIDPAGDRNFAAYLECPEVLLKLDEVDALIFMAFGGFSSFLGPMNPAAQFSASKGHLTVEKPFEHRNNSQWDIRSILSLVSPFFTVGEDKWRKRFEDLFTPVIKSGEVDVALDNLNLADLSELYHILDSLLGIVSTVGKNV